MRLVSTNRVREVYAEGVHLAVGLEEVAVHPARVRDVLRCRHDAQLAVDVDLLSLGV